MLPVFLLNSCLCHTDCAEFSLVIGNSTIAYVHKTNVVISANKNVWHWQYVFMMLNADGGIAVA